MQRSWEKRTSRNVQQQNRERAAAGQQRCTHVVVTKQQSNLKGSYPESTHAIAGTKRRRRGEQHARYGEKGTRTLA